MIVNDGDDVILLFNYVLKVCLLDCDSSRLQKFPLSTVSNFFFLTRNSVCKRQVANKVKL